MNKVALFCLDPGGNTGIAHAVVDTDLRTVSEAMRKREARGSRTITHRDDWKQIIEICGIFEEWYRYGRKRAPIDLVVEDWNPLGARNKEASSPARIAWGVVGMLVGANIIVPEQIIWVQPSAQRHATQARLKPMDAWVVGKEHERAAHALMVEHLMKLMGS